MTFKFWNKDKWLQIEVSIKNEWDLFYLKMHGFLSCSSYSPLPSPCLCSGLLIRWSRRMTWPSTFLTSGFTCQSCSALCWRKEASLWESSLGTNQVCNSIVDNVSTVAQQSNISVLFCLLFQWTKQTFASCGKSWDFNFWNTAHTMQTYGKQHQWKYLSLQVAPVWPLLNCQRHRPTLFSSVMRADYKKDVINTMKLQWNSTTNGTNYF